MRALRAVFSVFAAGILATGCGDGAELLAPPSEPAPSLYCPYPCDPPPAEGYYDPNCLGRPSNCPERTVPEG